MKNIKKYISAASILIIVALIFVVLYDQKKPAELYECTTDAQCNPAGCSNQICTIAGEKILTTCEFRDEYSCLSKTTCGCINHKCAWDQNSEYTACLNQFK